jgi:hypothetical protein
MARSVSDASKNFGEPGLQSMSLSFAAWMSVYTTTARSAL